MLKLTYTESGFYLESLTQSLERWVDTLSDCAESILCRLWQASQAAESVFKE